LYYYLYSKFIAINCFIKFKKQELLQLIPKNGQFIPVSIFELILSLFLRRKLQNEAEVEPKVHIFGKIFEECIL